MNTKNNYRNPSRGFKSLLMVVALILLGTHTSFANGEDEFFLSDAAIMFILGGVTLVLVIAILSMASVVKAMIKLFREKHKLSAILLLIGLFSATGLSAATGENKVFVISEEMIYAFIILDIVLLGVFFYLLSLYKGLKRDIYAEEEVVGEVEEEGLAEKWYKLNNAVPMEQEDEILMDHEYDGIRELDNGMPPWFMYLFYGTIAFAVFYLAYYHVFGVGKLQMEEYEHQMAEGQRQVEEYRAQMAEFITEDNVTFVDDKSRLKNGEKIYIAQCATCHGQKGEGGVGPNLTDDYWIHGGTVSEIFATIKYGVPEKGMIPWEAQLSPSDMQDVTSYIITLRGTLPEGEGKDPEGELVSPEELEVTEVVE